MAYADNLSKDFQKSQFLVVIKPARRVTDFTLVSGDIYTTTFDYGNIVSISQDGTELTEVTGSTPAAGQYSFDKDTDVIFIQSTDSTDPNNLNTIVTYELHFGTLGLSFPRIPDTAKSDTNFLVYYEPIVVRSPSLKATQSDNVFGFLPTQTSQLILTEAPHLLQRHLYDSSFNKRQIEVYHFFGQTEDTTNVKKVLNGLMNNVSFKDRQVRISVTDRIDLFDSEFRPTDVDFYKSSVFSELDPSFEGAPIRYVYGRVDGFQPINIDYLLESPTTSDNRLWGVRADKANLNEITQNVSVSPSSTTTRIFLDSIVGMGVGDTVHIDKATDESATITAVGANFIDITPALVSGVPGSGDVVNRGTVGSVTIIQDDVIYNALIDRDYTIDTSTSVLGFKFKTTLESNLGMPNTLSPNDTVLCRVYGKQNNVTLGGPAFGTDETETGNLTAGPVILLDLLKRFTGISESDIDSTSFSTLLSETTEALSFAIPKRAGDSFPKIKEILAEMILSMILKLYIDQDQMWAVDLVEPITTTEKTIEDFHILIDSFDYDFDYKDIYSDTIVSYRRREVPAIVGVSGPIFDSVTSSSDTAKFLHLVNRTNKVESLHLRSADAQNLSDHLQFIFGDRRGQLTVSVKNEFFLTEIADRIKISRTRLPGFSFDKKTDREREFSTIETNKSLANVTITLDDQKGIEDNEGSW